MAANEYEPLAVPFPATKLDVPDALPPKDMLDAPDTVLYSSISGINVPIYS